MVLSVVGCFTFELIVVGVDVDVVVVAVVRTSPPVRQHEVPGRRRMIPGPVIRQRISKIRQRMPTLGRKRDAPSDDLVDDDLRRSAEVGSVQLGEEVVLVDEAR